jgi:ribosomal protein S26
MAAGVIVLMFIEDKVITILLYCIVCQVHVEVIKVAMLRPNILLCCKPR